MGVKMRVYSAHLSTHFKSTRAALNAITDIMPGGKTHSVYTSSSEEEFVQVLNGVHVWHVIDSPYYCYAPADDPVNQRARERLQVPNPI